MVLSLLAVWACAQTRLGQAVPPAPLSIPSSALAAAAPIPSSPLGLAALALPPRLVSPLALRAVATAGERGPKLEKLRVDFDGARRLPRAAAAHDYLLVPGLLWDVVDDYFQPNRRRLEGLGLKASILDVDPLGSTAANGRVVARALRAAERPVVVLAHSKGALDTLEALRSEPDLVPKVRALVAIQSPYFGAAFADWASRPRLLRDLGLALARLVMRPGRLLRTSPFRRDEALRDISKEVRARAAEPLPAGLAVFSIATTLTSRSRLPWVSWATAGTLSLVSGDSDGLVETRDALIPGSRAAILEQVSHIDTVSEPVHWKHRVFGAQPAGFAGALTEAILAWVFKH